MAVQSAGQAWALGNLLTEAITEGLATFRGAPIDDVSPARHRTLMSEDLASGVVDREAWSSLYYRFVASLNLQVQEMASTAGFSERHVRRRMGRGYTLLANRLCGLEVEAIRNGEGLAGAPLSDRVVVTEPLHRPPERAPVVDPPAATTSSKAPAERPSAFIKLLTALANDKVVATLDEDELRGALRYVPQSLTEYRLSRVLAWSEPRYQLDQRFVHLTLLLDQGERRTGERWLAEPRKADRLSEVLSRRSEPCLVVLGAPGSGKSTLLRRLELDAASAGLQGESDVVTFYAPLSAFRPENGLLGEVASPLNWLAGLWRVRYPALPALDALMASGRLLLLLDGLNEIPHASEQEYRLHVAAWKRFLTTDLVAQPGNRALFTCRSLDYSAPLSSPDQPVPQVRIEPLDEVKMADFLARHTPRRADEILRALRSSGQLGLFGSPYLLRLLVDQDADERLPEGRAALFTDLVRRVLQRELERDSAPLTTGDLLSARDCRRLTQVADWPTPTSLPEHGPLIRALADLAYAMQASGSALGAAVRLPFDEAAALLPAELADRVITAGAGLGLLDEGLITGDVAFAHQLLQEYFAARRMAASTDFKLLGVAWQRGAVQPPLSTARATLGPGEPLPPQSTGGWDETAVLAAAMSPNSEAFVMHLAEANLPLAARCAAEPGVAVPAGVVTTLRSALISRCEDPVADVRARIAAGLALGSLGDPRLEKGRASGTDDAYLLPTFIPIPGGDFVIGSDEGFAEDEAPVHTVHLGGFRIARFPVTNAEWGCFMAAGAYQEPRWWDTPAAEAWRQGRGTNEGSRWSERYWRRRYLDTPDLLDQVRDIGHMTESMWAQWHERLLWDDPTFEADLVSRWPDGRLVEPAHWRDPAFNNPAQPVTGISWYEARAYTNWLAASTGMAMRLPTEVEWEAAARGSAGRRFAWGETFDVERTNTAESRLLRPAPVGSYPEGRTPDGLDDVTGTAYEWTSSLYGLAPDQPAFGYPYVADDGREDAESPADMLRVARGGSYAFDQQTARAANRGPAHPALRSDVGVRVVVGI